MNPFNLRMAGPPGHPKRYRLAIGPSPRGWEVLVSTNILKTNPDQASPWIAYIIPSLDSHEAILT